ncbi:MAG: hypothetical protein ACXAD7_21590, partial [Candidatus Kariarchaeaceae archaeon]
MKHVLFFIAILASITFSTACSIVPPETHYLSNLELTNNTDQISASIIDPDTFEEDGVILIDIQSQELKQTDVIESFGAGAPNELPQNYLSNLHLEGESAEWTLKYDNGTILIDTDVPTKVDNATVDQPNHNFFVSERLKLAYLLPYANDVDHYFIFSTETGSLLKEVTLGENDPLTFAWYPTFKI